MVIHGKRRRVCDPCQNLILYDEPSKFDLDFVFWLIIILVLCSSGEVGLRRKRGDNLEKLSEG